MPNEFGRENVYRLDDRENNGIGGFDNYDGEEVLVIDEFRGDIAFHKFLMLLQGYETEAHGRGTANNKSLRYTRVDITSKYLPGELYANMVARDKNIDRDIESQDQLFRRITATYIHRAFYKGQYVPNPFEFMCKNGLNPEELDYGYIKISGAVKDKAEMRHYLNLFATDLSITLDITADMVEDRNTKMILEIELDNYLKSIEKSEMEAADEAAGFINLEKYGYHEEIIVLPPPTKPAEKKPVYIPPCQSETSGFRCMSTCKVTCKFPAIRDRKDVLPTQLRY